MFVVSEDQLKGLIAPITPFYGTPQEWLNLEEGQLTTFSDIYRTQPGVRAVVDFISGHLGRMPIKLFKQEDAQDGGEGQRTHLRKHPMQKLLNVPNGHKRVGRSAFWRDAWMDFLLYDRMCLVKIRDLTSGDPVSLVRIPPVWFTPYGENYWWPEEIRIIGNRGFANFPIEDCVYIHGYDPVDPRIGVSPMTTLKSILEEEAAGTAWRKRFWSQGAQPTMVVSRPDTAPDWDDNARDRFIESLRAAAARGKPLLLEEGMTTNPSASFNPKSTEYLTTKKFTRDEVLRQYNMPVGLFEQATASNIAQYRAYLYSEAFAPLLSRWVDDLETQLLTDWSDDPFDEGLFLEPAIDEKIRGDIMSQLPTLVQAAGGPILTVAESRAFINAKTLPDSQKTDILNQPTTVGKADSPPPAAPAAPGAPGTAKPGAPGQPGRPLTGSTDKPTRDDRDQSQNQPPTATGGAPQATPPKKPVAKSLKASPTANRAYKQFVAEVTKTLQEYAKRQKSSVLSKMGAKAMAFNTARWNKELQTDLLREKKRITHYYGAETADGLGFDFDLERTGEYLAAGAAAEAKGFNANVAQFLQAERSIDEVSAKFDAMIQDGMPAMAQDVVASAKSFATHEAAEQSGKKLTKVWNVTSGNPRPTHDAQDGEEVGISDTFSNGLRYPHDPNGDIGETAGCTCEMSLNVSGNDDTEES